MQGGVKESVNVAARPRAGLVAALGFVGLTGIGFIAAAAVGEILVLAVAGVAMIAVAGRGVAMKMWTEGDELHVRNFTRSFVIRRSEIARFVVVDGVDPGSRYAWERIATVELRDGRSRELTATATTYFTWFSLAPKPDKRNRADVLQNQLQSWLHNETN